MRIALLAAVLFAVQAKHLRHRGPVIDLRGAEQLTATIREDELVLNTVPDLSIVAETGPVCKYILTNPDGTHVPFLAEVVDRYSGAAVIRVQQVNTLDCKQATYSLNVQAVRCDDENNVSEPVPLKITVKDTNNHSPEFDSPWYAFHIDEGRIHNEIARLKATDADCGDPFGEICEYRITNALNDLPFTISNQGVLKNTAPLNFTATKSYILTVVAIDCGMKESKSALVTVHVNEACVPGFQKMSDRIEFNPGSSEKKLLPEVETKLCEKESKCEVESVEATVELKTSHVSGCARDTLFDPETVKDCGLNPNTVSLLPKNGDKETSFDGATNAIVVDNKNLVPDHFSLSFSMRHPKGSKEEQNNKQHILCESDESTMNRHHFSVYVRHCKLELVLRREAGAAAEFKAAEWRWAASEVCDNEWHSYSLLFNGVDDVKLVVDGQLFSADERNPEILDDWPLHKILDVKTKMVLGACWHGRQQQFAQFFSGSLSAVNLLTGVTETPESIKCSHQCKEKLTVSEKDLAKDDHVTLSADHQTATIRTSSVEQLQKVLKTVSYSNSNEKTALGHRAFTLSAKASCKDGKQLEIPASKAYIFVQKETLPSIAISGSALISANQHQVKLGTPMIPDLKITVSKTNTDDEVQDITAEAKLDYCKVHLKPSRDMDLEYFSSPASLIASMEIDFEHDKEGILLRGEESVQNYHQVLNKVHYFNTRPDTYSKRIYSVQCAMAKGKVISNEFVVTMTITPAPEETPSPSISAEDTLDMMERHFEPAFDQLGNSRLQNILEMDLPRPKALMSHHGYDVGQGAIAGGAVAVVVVICVGFLLVLLVVGVLKMRDVPSPKRRKNRRQDDGLHWDDSGMNITINPLDDVEKSGAGEVDFSDEEEDDESSDNDSECSFRDEEVSDDEEATEVLPHLDGPRNGLEWDDEAALTPNTRSYRV